jgi:hypothetical protein
MILFVDKAKYVAAKNIWHQIIPIRMEAKIDLCTAKNPTKTEIPASKMKYILAF